MYIIFIIYIYDQIDMVRLIDRLDWMRLDEIVLDQTRLDQN